jgi:TPR repeat protein
VAQDYVEAYKWFSLAARAGYIPLADQYRERAASFLSPGDISKAQRLTQEWLAQRRAR